MTLITEHGAEPSPKKHATKEHFNGPDIPFDEVIKVKSRSQSITFRQPSGGITPDEWRYIMSYRSDIQIATETVDRTSAMGLLQKLTKEVPLLPHEIDRASVAAGIKQLYG